MGKIHDISISLYMMLIVDRIQRALGNSTHEIVQETTNFPTFNSCTSFLIPIVALLASSYNALISSIFILVFLKN